MLKSISLLALLLLLVTSMHSQPVISKTENIKYLALGDSYTIGESVTEKERWPNQLATLLRLKGYRIEAPKIIAKTGWRTDNLAQAIEEAQLKNEYSLVSLLIGVNNQYQGLSAESYKPEFEKLLQKAIELAGGRKERVFVVSIPDYGYTPFGEPKQEQISKAIDEFNSINWAVCRQEGIRYYNITEFTRKGLSHPEYVASDKLHPSGKMYEIWASLIAVDF